MGISERVAYALLLFERKETSCFLKQNWSLSPAVPGGRGSCGCCGGTWLDFLSGKRIWKFQFPNVKPSNFPVGVSTVRVRQWSALWAVLQTEVQDELGGWES